MRKFAFLFLLLLLIPGKVFASSCNVFPSLDGYPSASVLKVYNDAGYMLCGYKDVDGACSAGDFAYSDEKELIFYCDGKNWVRPPVDRIADCTESLVKEIGKNHVEQKIDGYLVMGRLKRFLGLSVERQVNTICKKKVNTDKQKVTPKASEPVPVSGGDADKVVSSGNKEGASSQGAGAKSKSVANQGSGATGSNASAKVYKGKVLDSKTGEPLAFANVSRNGVTSEGTSTNVDGEFSTEFSDNKITFSHIGCKQVTKEMTTDYTTILLDCDVQLDKVEITFQKICESEQNKGKFDATNNKCICPEGRQWNDARNECVVSSVPTLPSKGLTESKMPDKLEPRQSVATDKEFCESTENAGQWNEKKKTCKCPEKKVWIVGNKKCEDADLEAVRQACWKLMQKGQTLWDEETNSCTCIKEDETADESKQYEYDSRRKTGKCVTVKQEKEPKMETPKPKPKERTDAEKAAALAEKQTAYDDAKETEQSLANRTLTTATTAAMGIGAMQAAQGYSEQKADERADRDMSAYMQTFRCSYADGKSVKGGVEEVELPGGNDEVIMKYRSEYLALAANLKERKESLNMKSGIESEVILDKANAGLYDDENVGITGGQYSSLYRAKMGGETDAAMIASEQETSANRLKYGAIAVGAGAVVGIVGNSLINGKLGEKIKEAKTDKDSKRKESSALKDLKQCLKDAGTTNYSNLKFDKFTPSVLNLDDIDCKRDLTNIAGKDATTLFTDSDDATVVSEQLTKSFGEKNASLMLGDGVGYCYYSIEDIMVRGDSDLDECKNLETGDWVSKFSSGEAIRGISVCSTVRPDGMEHEFVPEFEQQEQIQASYEDWIKNGRKKPTVGVDQACYCKMNGSDKKWVFDSYHSGFGCGDGCAYFCSSLVKDYKDFRDAVMGNK